jgi:hypothetical protein
MATFYCDLYAGNDANDGLTPATPKLTINAATALVTTYSDDVRVRGIDNLYTDIGEWRWINETKTVTRSGNYTGVTVANEYIFKTVNGNTPPQLYKVGSIAYDSGTDITTITLTFSNTNYRYWDIVQDETVSTSKLSSTPTVAIQNTNKNGYISGSGISAIRSQISGGWDSGYTTQNSFTVVANTTGVFFQTQKNNWEVNRFIAIGYSGFMNGYDFLIKDCSLVYFVGDAMRNSRPYCLNSFFNHFHTGYPIFNDIGGGLIKDCIAYNHYGTQYYWGMVRPNGACTFENTRFANHSPNNSPIFGQQNLGHGFYLNGCTVICRNTATYGAFHCNYGDFYGYLKDCNLEFNFNCNYVLYASGCTFKYVGTTANAQVVAGTYHNETYATREAPTFYKNTFNLNSVSTNNYIDMRGIFYENTGITFSTSQKFNADGFLLYTNENLNYFTPIGSVRSGVKYYNNYNQIVFTTTGNTKYFQYGFAQLSNDYYSGKTGGTNSIKLGVCTKSAVCDFTTTDFIINKSTAYNLSFYAKGSGSYTLHWNIYNRGEFLYSWQTQAINASTWTNITKAIAASDWNMSGTATLVIRIPSQAKGTYALIDYIQLT